MYNKELTDTIYGLVGFTQPTQDGYDIVDAENLVSRSGLRVDMVSAFAKIQYLKDAAANDAAKTAEEFNAFLKSLQEHSITEVLDDVFSEPDVIESKPLYSDSPDVFKALGDNGYFVGYELELEQKSNVALTINKALFYFAEAGTVKLLLFNQFKQAPIQSKEVEVTANELKAQALGWEITQGGDIVGGKYYLGYISTGAPQYKEGYRCQNSYKGVQVCEGRALKDTETTIDPAEFASTGKGYGLNFDISVKKDISNSVIQNEKSLASALALKVAIKSVERVAASLRSNGNERAAQSALFELHGNPKEGIHGLFKRYEAEVKKIQQSFTCYGESIHIAHND